MKVKVENIWLEVDYAYHPSRRGQRDSMGVPLTPDDPEDAEITAVYIGATDIMPLLEMRMVQRIEEEVIKGVKEDGGERKWWSIHAGQAA